MTDADAVDRFAAAYGVEEERVDRVRDGMVGDLGDYHRRQGEVFGSLATGLLLIAQEHQRCRLRRNGKHCGVCLGIQTGLAALVAEQRAAQAHKGRANIDG